MDSNHCNLAVDFGLANRSLNLLGHSSEKTPTWRHAKLVLAAHTQSRWCLAVKVGLEPTTKALTVPCSSIELLYIWTDNMCFILQKLETYVREELGMTRLTVLVCLRGSGRIWTHGALITPYCFQDSCIKPLCHTSFVAHYHKTPWARVLASTLNTRFKQLPCGTRCMNPIAGGGLEPSIWDYETQVIPFHYPAIDAGV